MLSANQTLEIAIQTLDVDKVRELLTQGIPGGEKADPNALFSDPKHRTPLFLAVHLGSVEIVNLLMDHGADPHFKAVLNNSSQTPLSYAVIKNSSSIIAAIIRHEKYTYEYNSGCAVLEAMHQGDRSHLLPLLLEKHTVDALIKFPVSVWSYNSVKTAMYYAVERDDIRSVTLLLAHGGETRYELKKAIQNEEVDLVKALLDAGVSPNLNYSGSDKTLPTPLFVAIKKGNLTIVQHLVNAGADMHHERQIGFNSQTPVSFAIIENKFEIFEWMVKHEKYQYVYKSGIAVLEAMWKKQPHYLPILLEKHTGVAGDISVDTWKYNGEYTAAMLAKKNDDMVSLKLLIKHGARTDISLVQAIHKGEWDMVDELLKNGANVNEHNPGYSPSSPLTSAIGQNNMPLVNRLIEAGAAINDSALVYAFRQKNEHAWRAMLTSPKFIYTYETGLAGTYAMERANPEALKLLLEKHVGEAAKYPVNHYKIYDHLTKKSMTAMDYALKHDDMESVALLLEHGAAPLGLTDAVENDDEERVNVMITHGANPNDTQSGTMQSALMLAVKKPEIFGLLICRAKFTFNWDCVDVIQACIKEKQPYLAMMLLSLHDPQSDISLDTRLSGNLTAFENATIEGFHELANELKRHGASPPKCRTQVKKLKDSDLYKNFMKMPEMEIAASKMKPVSSTYLPSLKNAFIEAEKNENVVYPDAAASKYGIWKL